VAKFLGLLYSVLLGEAFKIHVDLLYSVAANFEWRSDLYEIYVHRSLQATYDTAQMCVSEFKRWVNKAGPSPRAFTDELTLLDEFNVMTDCFRQKILVPLTDASGPTSYLVRYLKDQQRRSEHMQYRSAGLYEAKMFSARGPTGSNAAPQLRGPPPKAQGGAAAPANTRAKGGPTPVDAGSSFPIRTLTSLKERSVAGFAVGGSYLEYSTNDGCSHGPMCKFPHTPIPVNVRDPAAMLLLSAGGGPVGTASVPLAERAPLVTNFRRMVALSAHNVSVPHAARDHGGVAPQVTAAAGAAGVAAARVSGFH